MGSCHEVIAHTSYAPCKPLQVTYRHFSQQGEPSHACGTRVAENATNSTPLPDHYSYVSFLRPLPWHMDDIESVLDEMIDVLT
jgi:hypothetical protein